MFAWVRTKGLEPRVTRSTQFGLIGNTVASGEEAAIMAKIMESAGSCLTATATQRLRQSDAMEFLEIIFPLLFTCNSEMFLTVTINFIVEFDLTKITKWV